MSFLIAAGVVFVSIAVGFFLGVIVGYSVQD